MIRLWLAAAWLAAAHLLATCGARSSNGELIDVPTPTNFIRKTWPRACVFGNYLYMDGGQVSQYSYSPSGPNVPEGINSTLSLDLSVSWRREDVRMRRIGKSAPKIIRQAIFIDHASGTFYTWGGLVRNVREPQTELWKFRADGSGGGSWSTETGPDHGMSMLRRSYGGAYTSTPESGFYFGGMSEETDRASRQQSWTNHTEAPYSASKTLYSASAHYVPNFATKGLIMILGGSQWNPEVPGNLSDISMETVFFMDPATKRWYSQQTSGRAPPPRRWFCTVGANSNGDTYEIFVFGGENSGRGFPQGLGVFDLTALKWKPEYDAGAARYEMPDIIKSWYDEGSLAQVKYSTGIEDLLNLSSFGPDVPDGRRRRLSPGAVGGIAGGSIVGAVLVGVVVFLLVRRLRRPTSREPEAAATAAKDSDHPSAPASTTVSKHEKFELSAQDPRYQRAELHGNHSTAELPA